MYWIQHRTMNNSNPSKSVWEQVSQHPWFPYILFFILAISILNFIYNTIFPAFTLTGIDFRVYYDYSVNPDPRLADTEYPWFLYLPIWSFLMKPFILFSFPVAKNIWVIINILLLVVFIQYSYTWCLNKLPGVHSLFLVTLISAMVLNFSPAEVSIRNGQINILILLLMGYSFYAYEKGLRVWSALALAVCITTKITPAVLLLFWAWKREWKLVGLTIGFYFLMFLLPLPILGSELYKNYFILGQHYATCVKIHYNNFGNVSLYSFFRNAMDHGWLSPYFPAMGSQIYFSFTMIVLSCVVSARKTEKNMQLFALEYGLWCVTMTLLSYFNENHYYVFTLITFITSIASIHLIHGPFRITLLVVSWFLIYVTFLIEDLSQQHPFALNYLDFVGVLILFSVMLNNIWDFKKKTTYVQST